MDSPLIEFFRTARTYLHARVESVIDFDFERQFKVAVVFIRTHEGVGAAFIGSADNTIFFNAIGGCAILLRPAS